MRKEIIDKYQIRFENRKIDFGQGPENVKLIDININDLGGFLISIKNPDYYTSELLLEIANALEGPETEEGIEKGGTTVLFYIHKTRVDFYSNYSDDFFSIPTSDFKEIIIGWRDFLLQPPLDGTKR